VDPLLESTEEDSLENQLGGWLDLPTAEKASAIAVHLVQEIEGLGSDSKLAAFGALLNRLEVPKTSPTRICVLTEYLGTLFYVAAEIEIMGSACRLFHGRMSAEDRQSALALFSSAGGILTATRAAMSKGIALGEVTDLVLYDVADGKDALQQVLSRFDRFGRRTQLNVYTLVPSGDAERPVSESLRLLRQAFGSPGPETRI
jgi:superfamily II DNA/RNA helicase